jgi:hypothetical protein
MLYLIKSKAIDNVVAGPPEQMIPLAENVLLPSFKTLTEGERVKKFAGGALAGARGFAIIADFANHDEANTWVMSLPFWNQQIVEITPLVSFQSRVDSVTKMVQNWKAMLRK